MHARTRGAGLIEPRTIAPRRREGEKCYWLWSLARLGVVVFFVSAARSLVLFRLVVERLVRDAEDLGGLAAIAVGHVERLFDDDALHLFHRLAERDHHAVARAALARAEELIGETLDRET